MLSWSRYLASREPIRSGYKDNAPSLRPNYTKRGDLTGSRIMLLVDLVHTTKSFRMRTYSWIISPCVYPPPLHPRLSPLFSSADLALELTQYDATEPTSTPSTTTTDAGHIAPGTTNPDAFPSLLAAKARAHSGKKIPLR